MSTKRGQSTTGGCLPQGDDRLDMLAFLLENSSEVVSRHSPDGQCLYVSPSVTTVLGKAPEDLLGWGTLETMHPDDAERFGAIGLEPFADGACVEFRLRHLDGTWRTLEARLRRLTDAAGTAVEIISIARDITALRAAEAEGSKRTAENNSLVQQIRLSEKRHAQAHEVERAAAEQLRAVDDMKHAFLTSVSHELRTPLTALIGYAETLTMYEDRISASTRKSILERMVVNAQRLRAQVADLLDLDRIVASSFTPRRTRIDVATVAQRAVDTSDVRDSHPVHVRCEEVSVIADPDLVERIVRNLLSNAVLHTHPGTDVWVHVRPVTGGAMIEVEDAGPGIDPAIARDMFEPFRQGPTVTPSSPRVGIGLALVSNFSRLHGGRAWVDQRPGGGAAFRVFLPWGEDHVITKGTTIGLGSSLRSAAMRSRERRTANGQAPGRGSLPLSGTRPNGS